MLRFYFEVARTAFRRQLIYRWANLAGLATNVFFGVVISSVFIALYHSRPSAGGYDLRDALRYWWVVQAMIMVVLPFGWWDLMLTIRSGEVAADLSKPCDFYWYWFSREAGRDVYYLLFRCLPTYLAGALIYGLGGPPALSLWPVFAASLALGAALGIVYRFLYNIIAFWIIEARAAGGMAAFVALFLTGSYLPLVFFPPWLYAIVTWLPFSSMMNAPAEVFLGKLSGGALLLTLLQQVLWVVALTLVARWVAALAARRVIVQGG